MSLRGRADTAPLLLTLRFRWR